MKDDVQSVQQAMAQLAVATSPHHSPPSGNSSIPPPSSAPSPTAENVVTSSTETESTTGSPTRPWYEDPQWLYTRQQLELRIANKQWADYIFKRKLDPGLRPYIMPVPLMSVMPKLETMVSAEVTWHSIENLEFVRLVAKKHCEYHDQLVKQKLWLYEIAHGRPYEAPLHHGRRSRAAELVAKVPRDGQLKKDETKLRRRQTL